MAFTSLPRAVSGGKHVRTRGRERARARGPVRGKARGKARGRAYGSVRVGFGRMSLLPWTSDMHMCSVGHTHADSGGTHETMTGAGLWGPNSHRAELRWTSKILLSFDTVQ